MNRNKKIGRIFAFLLALCMLLTSAPMNVYAETHTGSETGIFGFSGSDDDSTIDSGTEEAEPVTSDAADKAKAGSSDSPDDANAVSTDEEPQGSSEESVLTKQTIHAEIMPADNAPSVLRKLIGLFKSKQSAKKSNDTLYANDDIVLTGKLPDKAIVEAKPVTVEVEGQNVLAAYDIKIYVNENQKARGKTWQPADDKIEVTVKSDALSEIDGSLNVYHMEDEEAEAEKVAAVKVEDGGVSFEAESFSVYAIAEQPFRITYELYLEPSCANGTEYWFDMQGEDGATIRTNKVIVKNGEILQFPEAPVQNEAGANFRGWFEKDLGNEQRPGKISEALTEDKTVKLYAQYGDTYYLVFYEDRTTSVVSGEEKTYWPISQTIKVVSPENDRETFDLSTVQPKITYESQEFINWYTVGEGGAKTNQTGEINVTGNMYFYPAYKQVRHVSYYTGETGSGATYIASKSVDLDSDGKATLSQADPGTVPTMNGYLFLGWCVKDTYNGADGDTVTDADGNPVCNYVNTCTHDENCDHTLIINDADKQAAINKASEFGLDGSTLYSGHETISWSQATGESYTIADNTTVYAVWVKKATASYTVVVKAQNRTDAVGQDPADKSYYILGSQQFTGSTGVDDIVSVRLDGSKLMIDQYGAASQQYTGTLPDLSNFYLSVSDSSNVEPDGSTIIEVKFDREVYTIEIKAGDAYPEEVPPIYEPTQERKTSGVYYGSPDGSVPTDSTAISLTYKFAGWSYGGNTVYPNLKVYNGALTNLRRNVYTNSNDTKEGTVGYASRSQSISALGYYPIARPRVIAVYAFFRADGTIYPGTVYKRLEGKTLATLTGLYEDDIDWGDYADEQMYYHPSGRVTYYVDTNLGENFYYDDKGYYIKNNNGVAEYGKTIADSDKLQRSSKSKTASVYFNTPKYIDHKLNGTTYSNSNPQSARVLSSYNFSTVETQNVGYRTHSFGTEEKTLYVYNKTTTVNVKLKTITVSDVIDNLNKETHTLTLFIQPKTTTTLNGGLHLEWYKLPEPDTAIADYDTYLEQYKEKILSRDSSAEVIASHIRDDNNTNFSGIHTRVADANFTWYYSASKDKTGGSFNEAGNQIVWKKITKLASNDTLYLKKQSDPNTNPNYPVDTKNDLTTTITYNSTTNPYYYYLLYEPTLSTINFKSESSSGVIGIGSPISVPTGWNLNDFQSVEGTPLYTYNSQFNADSNGEIDGEVITWYTEFKQANPSYAHKTFQGWYYDQACTVPFDPSDVIKGEVILYAKWDDPWYIVEVDPNGGSIGGNLAGSTWFWVQDGKTVTQSPVTRNYVEVTEHTPASEQRYYYYYNPYNEESPAPTRDSGYVRTGGTVDADGKYTVTYTENGETKEESHYGVITTQEYVKQEGIYQLLGWYKVNPDGSLGDEYSFSSPVTYDVAGAQRLKIKAAWKKVGVYTIVYDIGKIDGTDNPRGTLVSQDLETLYEDTSSEVQAFIDGAEIVIDRYVQPTQAGDQFLGWQVSDSGMVYNLGERFILDSNLADGSVITLTAQYGLIGTTKLSYDANGGSGTLTDLESLLPEESQQSVDGNTINNIEYNDVVTLSSGKGFTRAGYGLLGWNSNKAKANAGEVEFELGEQVAVNDKDGNKLYAVWKELGGIAKITDKDGKLLYTTAAHTVPAIYKTLADAFNAAAGKLYNADGTEYPNDASHSVNIEMLQDVTQTVQVTPPAMTRPVTLTTASRTASDTYPYSGSGDAATIKRGGTYQSILYLADAIDLTLKDIVLDGNRETYSGRLGALIYMAAVANSLTLEDKAILQNSKSMGHGGAIDAENYSTLTMKNGAVIKNCEGTYGGAVHVYETQAVFNMTGGEIIGCNATDVTYGAGAVYLYSNGTFNFSGGTIKDCTSKGPGGAVNILSTGTFTMTGGEITGCSSEKAGGAVNMMAAGTFTMSGGEISSNTATNASAVYVSNTGKFTMTGGEIDGNTATKSGSAGAIEVGGTGSRLNFSGKPVIYDNKDSANKQANVLLNQASAAIIQVTGELQTGAKIGVWPTNSQYQNEGNSFATTVAEGATYNLTGFVNDFTSDHATSRKYLYGWPNTTGEAGDVIWRAGLQLEAYEYSLGNRAQATLISAGGIPPRQNDAESTDTQLAAEYQGLDSVLAQKIADDKLFYGMADYVTKEAELGTGDLLSAVKFSGTGSGAKWQIQYKNKWEDYKPERILRLYYYTSEVTVPIYYMEKNADGSLSEINATDYYIDENAEKPVTIYSTSASNFQAGAVTGVSIWHDAEITPKAADGEKLYFSTVSFGPQERARNSSTFTASNEKYYLKNSAYGVMYAETESSLSNTKVLTQPFAIYMVYQKQTDRPINLKAYIYGQPAEGVVRPTARSLISDSADGVSYTKEQTSTREYAVTDAKNGAFNQYLGVSNTSCQLDFVLVTTDNSTWQKLSKLRYNATAQKWQFQPEGSTAWMNLYDSGEVVQIELYYKAVCKITDSGTFKKAYATLEEAFADINSGTVTGDKIEMLVENYTLTQGVTLNSGKTVTLTTASATATDKFPYTGSSGSTATITRGSSFTSASMLTNKGSLTLTNITLDGNNVPATTNGSIVNTAGTLTIGGGATLKNAKSQRSDEEGASGGAVYANATGATVNMNGGTITNCKAVATASGSAAFGGAIYIGSGSTLNMNGGTISNCEASGDSESDGGAIATEGGTVNISAAGNSVPVNITGNKAGYGGAIYINDGTLTIESNSVIESNTADNGGGVYVADGTFNMNNGRIAGNEATDGGGIYIQDNSVVTVTIDNGQLQGNTATSNGGGIYAGASATINNGVFGGNSADNGGFVYVAKGTLTFNNGIVGEKNDSNNQAYANTATNGGGFYVANKATLTATSGTIHNNTATTAGAGVYAVSGSKVNVSGGLTIYDNKVGTNQNNVYITNATTLNVSGSLGADAKVGVYVSGTIGGTSQPVDIYGKSGQVFGSAATSVGGLNKLVNDRIKKDGTNYLTGAAALASGKVMWEVGTLTVKKLVTGEMGDVTKDFTFALTVGTRTGENFAYTKNSTTGNIQSGDTFTLKHNETIELNVPYGEDITIAEEEVTGYTTRMSIGDNAVDASTMTTVAEGRTKTFILTTGKYLTVNNDHPNVAPTGVSLRFVPYILIALAGILLLLIRRRRSVTEK